MLFNAVGGDPVLAPTGSVRDVYLENSYNQMELNSTATGWMTVSNTEQYYASGNSGLSSKIWEALTEALDLADASIDFSQFDEDGDGYIDAISFIHSGYGAEWGGFDADGTFYTNRIWSHRWTSQPAWTSDEGVRVGPYHISPGLWDTSGSDIGRIGVIAHETGHFFGLPDLYDTDSSGGEGIGSYGMMANSWGFDFSQYYPPHFCPWSKIALGWLTPTVISTAGQYSLPQVEASPTVYYIDNGYPSDEYLLLENRQPLGFDSDMPQGGLAVWHIDDTTGYNTEGYPGQAGWPENGNHYRVALLQADGYYDLEIGFNRGDGGDVYHGAGVSAVDPSASPNTDAYQDGNILVTGNTISDISVAGATMTFTYSPTAPAVPNVASADFANAYGTVSGSYVDTRTQNDVYESIIERHSGGRPQNRHDRLDHVWSFSVSGGNHIYNVEAFYVDGGDADNGFLFQWSSNSSGPWTDMLTVTKTADDDTYQTFNMGSPSGTVYVRVTDTNRVSGQRLNDTIYIDHMFIDGGEPLTDPPDPVTNPDPPNGATGVGLEADLSWTTGAGSESFDVYFGLAPSAMVFQGSQMGTTFEPGTLGPNTTYYWQIDAVNVIGTTAGPVWSFTTGDVASTMHVDSILAATQNIGKGNKEGLAIITVVDDQGNPVADADVMGTFTGDYSETVVGATDAAGAAVLTTTATKRGGVSFTFCVDDISALMLSYDAAANVETCASF